MRKLFILLLCMSACSLLMAQNTNSIQEAMANYDYETALSLINKEAPTIPILYQKGRALKNLGNNREALRVFEEIIAQDSLNPLAYIEAAECCRSLFKGNQALTYYRKALDIHPDNKYVRIRYISLLLSQEQFKEALGESSLMSEKDSSATVLHLQAESFAGTKQPEAAMGCYEVIQEKYPNDFLAAIKLGAMYITADQYDYAIEATEKYRRIDSTNIAVNRQNALAYCLSNDYQTAIRRYEYLTTQGDSTLYTCYYLGISYYAVEKFYEAHDILEVARKHDPKNANLLYYLGRACANTSWKEQGVAYLKEAIQLSVPKDSVMIRLYIGMADCYKMAEMPKERIATIQERYNLYDKTNHKLLYDIAFIYQHSLKDKKNTERYLEAFLKTRPKEVKKEQPEVSVENGIVLDTDNYYNAAENWLKDLREKRKEDEFFSGESSGN